MYIANKTFTSKHKHNYEKGQRITNARYFFLAAEDKPNFDYHVQGDFQPHEEDDPNFGHPTSDHYYPASDVATHTETVVTESIQPTIVENDLVTMATSLALAGSIQQFMDDSPAVDPGPSFDPTPDPTPSFDSSPSYDSPSFGGGDGGGGGATDSW